ncbi:tyrosine-protein kinase receptor torso-like [Euwallacea similis]|uniref:tyrosine-protein kinase receptor torso-like n=1 Tax=Euwallacea similis TaxID=1736056 RepID=UPI00344B12E2
MSIKSLMIIIVSLCLGENRVICIKGMCLDCLLKIPDESGDPASCDNSLNCERTTDFEKIRHGLQSPQLLCRDETSLFFSWNYTHGAKYLLAYSLRSSLKYHFASTRRSYMALTNLSSGREYEIYLISFNPDGARSPQVAAKTWRSTEKKTAVFSLNYSLSVSDGSYGGRVVWKPGRDLSCYYEVLWYEKQEPGDYLQRRINLKKQIRTEFNLTHLEFGRKYHFAITSINSKGDLESPKKWLKIAVPGCLETFRNLSICPPSKPKNLTAKFLLLATSSRKETSLKLQWKLPPLKPDFYSLSLITSDRDGNYSNPINYNISGDKISMLINNVKTTSSFMVKLTAFSKAGASLPGYLHYLPMDEHVEHKTVFWIWAIVGASTCLSLLVSWWFFRKKLSFLLNWFVREKVENTIVKYSATDQEDSEAKWELSESKLIIDKIIGFGAFGIVQKGYYYLKPDKKFLIAIKTLKANPTPEQIKQFYDEIEIMKSVPYHAHIVRLIGVVTKNRLSNPLMLVEHCAKGDLQSFLRQVAFVLQESPVQTSDESIKFFNNKSYDLDGREKFVLEPQDLLSFARQIVLGMEFLSNLKVIHRDLAARNVLITENNILKISDFGLSRDIYTDNVYRKITGGKLPFRWMALESLTHQIYTTESDVWSFGIVLWEIVTLGGNPYPTVNTEELVNWLKGGYRMERPSNCNEDLYQIMHSCWQTSPSLRPTFKELRETFDRLLESKMQYISLEEATRYENFRS